MIRTLTLTNKKLLRIAIGVSLMFIAAQVRIPIGPVPITLQSSATLILALCYRRSEAVASLGIYLLLGLAGAPVFSNLNSGINYFFGYTCGYLIGMFLAVYIISTMREYFGDDNWLKLSIYGLIGTMIILVSGVFYISIYCGLGLNKALHVGLYPLLISGTVKALFTTSSVKLIRQRLK